MLCAIAFFVFYIASLLPTNAAPDYPLAIGGYGKAFFNTSIPLTNAKIWVEVLASPGHGWTNATFTNTTEVQVDDTGNYKLEVIVGDARRRGAIKKIRLFLESHFEGVLCWHRNVDLEYMYLYRPNRKPQRQFNYDIILVGSPPHDEPTWLQPEYTSDACFHPRLAVGLMVRVMCNKSVPMVNAHVILVVNRTSKGPLAIDVGVTADKGDYIGPAFLGADTRFSEVRNMILVFTNACGATNRLTNFTACTGIPLDYVYAYEEDFLPMKFIFFDQVDTTNHTCEGMEEVFGE